MSNKGFPVVVSPKTKFISQVELIECIRTEYKIYKWYLKKNITSLRLSRTTYYSYQKIYKEEGKNGIKERLRNKYKLTQRTDFAKLKLVLKLSAEKYELNKNELSRLLEKKNIFIPPSTIYNIWKMFNLTTKEQREDFDTSEAFQVHLENIKRHYPFLM